MQIDLFPINSAKTQQRACSTTKLSCGFAQPIHVYYEFFYTLALRLISTGLSSILSKALSKADIPCVFK